MKTHEAKPGEFTLVYNDVDSVHPVALTKEQHELMQELINCIPGKLHVLMFMDAKYVTNGKRNEKFCDRLKESLKTRGISQIKLSELTGINPVAISHYTCGRREPSLKNLVKICKCANIPFYELLD